MYMYINITYCTLLRTITSIITCALYTYCKHQITTIMNYRIAGNIDGEFNLAVGHSNVNNKTVCNVYMYVCDHNHHQCLNRQIFVLGYFRVEPSNYM